MLFHAIIIRESQIDEIPRMASEFGVRSFKAFMAYKGREISPSGIQGMGDDQIYTMFQRVKDVPGGVAIVHCENMEIIELHQKPLMAAGRQDTAAWSDGRPAWGELEAIRRMCQFAEAAAVQLLIPHMGVGLGSEFLRQKAWGPGRVATESCPHYLAFDKDTDRGVQGKVNPPLRGRDHIDALWQRLTDGTVDVMGSDHCPYTKAVKGDELWGARAGITAGSAMILPVLLTEGVNRGRLTMPDVVRLTSYNAAQLFGLYPKKGALEAGSDADLVIVDTDREVKVDLPALNSAVDFSPYEGYVARGWAATTIAGGRSPTTRERSSPTAPAAATSLEASDPPCSSSASCCAPATSPSRTCSPPCGWRRTRDSSSCGSATRTSSGRRSAPTWPPPPRAAAA